MAEPIVKQKSKDHRRRKSPGSRDMFDKQRHERNAARGKQRWVPSSFTGTIEELEKLGDEHVLRIVPAHWERP